MGPPGASWGLLVLPVAFWALLAPPGRASWGILVPPGAWWSPGTSWGLLGSPWASWVFPGFVGLPGVSWGLPGASRGGPPDSLLGPPAPSRSLLRLLGASWSLLVASWSFLVPSGPSWGASWGSPQDQTCIIVQILRNKVPNLCNEPVCIDEALCFRESAR